MDKKPYWAICAILFVTFVLTLPPATAREAEPHAGKVFTQDDSVIGTWVGIINGQQYEMVLREDGTMSFAEYDGTYLVRPGQLVVTMMGESGTYGLRVSGDKLWLTGQDIGGTVEFTRTRAESREGPLSPVRSTPEQGEDEEREEGTVQDQGLTGTWIGTIEGQEWEAVFRDDGTFTLNGNPGTYTFDGWQLTVSVGGESGTYDVELSGDTMRLSGGDLDAPINFTRKRERSGGLFSVPRTDTGDQREGQSEVSTSLQQQILGTWVALINNEEYTMVLNEDGSMQFAGYEWTFSVESGKLVVNTGADSITYNVRISGDELWLSGGDIEGTLKFTRSDYDDWDY